MGEGRIQCVLVVLRNNVVPRVIWNGLLIEHVDIDIAISQYLKGNFLYVTLTSTTSQDRSKKYHKSKGVNNL